MPTTVERGYKDQASGAALAQRILDNFPDCPVWYAVGVERLAGSYAYPPWERSAEELTKGLEAADKGVAALGDRLPKELYWGHRIFVHRVLARYYLKDREGALQAAREAAVGAPRCLSDRDILRHVYFSVKMTEPARLSEAAKLYFALCDFDEEWITEGIGLCNEALSGVGGPGIALQFARAQEEPGRANPLAEVKLYPLGDAEQILAAAGQDEEGRLNAYLYAGQVAEALTIAKAQLTTSAGHAGRMGAALRNLARCFKARDSGVARANQFLRFHQTGEGENPLAALEQEVSGG